MKLPSQISLFAKHLDLDDIGIADVRLYKRVSYGLVPREILPEARTAVVYLYTLDKLLINYGPWYVVSLCNHISKTNKKLEAFFEAKGFLARGVQENEYDRKTLVGKLSFREMAVLAGLGSVGKSQMFLHKRMGPGVVIGVVLTNATIRCNSPARDSYCLECDDCVSACPTRAIGPTFDPWRCKNRRKILGRGCGTLCVVRCPAGR